MSSSWPLAITLTILMTAVVVFGRRFVPEPWRQERRTLTIISLSLAGLTRAMLAIAIWLALS